MRTRNSAKMHALAWRLAISVALGAVITVLVAWASLFLSMEPNSITPTTNKPWPIAVPAHWPREPDRVVQAHSAAWSLVMYSQGIEGLQKRLKTNPNDAGYAAADMRSGWPFRALMRYHAAEWTKGGEKVLDVGVWRSGLPVPQQWLIARGYSVDNLYLLPVWPGFALNTLFYGMLAFAAMAGVSAMRRRRRFKCGLCVQCAYPLTGGNVCPECGVAVASTSESSAKNIEPAAPTPV